MPIDPYQDCPCGSGKKFKWCCQKLAKYAEQAEQLLESGQVAAAIQSLDEGLALDPRSLWLRTMKAQTLLQTHDHEPADKLLDEILGDKPGYLPALSLRLQHQLAHGDAAAATETTQTVLAATPADQAAGALRWMFLVGGTLSELGHPFAALKHLRFVAERDPGNAEIAREIREVESRRDFAPWLRDTWDLQPDLIEDGATGRPWREATALAGKGLWRKAASLFESITAQQPNRASAWLNLALCRAWIAADEAAAAALQRYAMLESDAESALHAEALAQCLDPRESAQSVDVVRIRYAIRDRTLLIQRLKDHARVQVHFLDVDQADAESDAENEFYLLDKPAVDDAQAATLEGLPLIIGLLRTRGAILELEFAEPTDNDARPAVTLEAAGDAIDPNGQREVAGTMPLSTHRLQRLWSLPQTARGEAGYRLRAAMHQQLYREIWPDTPLGWLDNKTPREASRVAELARSLRAALWVVEYGTEAAHIDVDLDSLRASLGIEPEPTLDGPAISDVARLPLARLRQVRAENLATDSLRTFFHRTARFDLPLAMQHAAAALVARPAECEPQESTAAFKLLIDSAVGRFDRAAATEWVARARRFDAAAGVPSPRATWEFSEWLVSLRFDPPQVWAPTLAELLTRHGQDKQASQELMNMLLATGFVRLLRHPSDPNKMVLDTQMLDQVLARFGTRQAGGIDLTPVGAGQQGKIWTPGADRPATAAPVWAPGQQPPPETKKLWTPGS